MLFKNLLCLLSLGVLYALNCAVVSITITTNGDNLAGSEFNLTATINISEIVDVQNLNITWLHSNGNIAETAGNGQLALNPSGPVVSTLDLVFSNLLMSQAGVYTLVVTITDTGLNTATLQRSYQVTVQSKCNFCHSSAQFQSMHAFKT